MKEKFKVGDDVTYGREKAKVAKTYELGNETYYLIKTEQGETKAAKEEDLKNPTKVTLKTQIEDIERDKREQQTQSNNATITMQNPHKSNTIAAPAQNSPEKEPENEKKSQEKVRKSVTVSNDYYSETKTVTGTKKDGKFYDEEGKRVTTAALRDKAINHAAFVGKAVTDEQLYRKVESQVSPEGYKAAKMAGENVTPINPYYEDKDNDGIPDIIDDSDGDGIVDKYDSSPKGKSYEERDDDDDGIPNGEDDTPHYYNSAGYDEEYDPLDLDDYLTERSLF